MSRQDDRSGHPSDQGYAQVSVRRSMSESIDDDDGTFASSAGVARGRPRAKTEIASQDRTDIKVCVNWHMQPTDAIATDHGLMRRPVYVLGRGTGERTPFDPTDALDHTIMDKGVAQKTGFYVSPWADGVTAGGEYPVSPVPAVVLCRIVRGEARCSDNTLSPFFFVSHRSGTRH